jgi:hypothetical protein
MPTLLDACLPRWPGRAAVSWPAVALAAWAVVTAGCCVRAVLGGGRNSVYPIFDAAGHNWLAGADLYADREEPYRYSPLATAALVPFAVLPRPLGEVLWRVANAAACLVGLLCWAAAVRGWPARARGLFLLLALPLSVGSVSNGQSNPLLLGLVLGAGAAAASGRWGLAALCAALACHLKAYPLALGLLLAALYPRRFGWRFALLLAAGAALPLLLQRPGYVVEQYGAWLRLLGAEDRQHLAPEFSYRDVRLPCRVWLAPLAPAAFVALQLAAGAALLALCAAGRRAGLPHARLLERAVWLSCCWMTVLGPATESATYILLAPALAAALLDAWGLSGSRGSAAGRVAAGRGGARARGLVAASAALFVSCLVAVWFPGGRHWHGLGIHALAGLLLGAALVLRSLGKHGPQAKD